MPAHFGAMTAVCLDPKHCWVAVGTSLGYLAIFDLRFDLLLKIIDVGQSDEPKRVLSCAIHPSKGKGRYLVLSLSAQSATDSCIQVWDIEHEAKIEEFYTMTHEPPLEESPASQAVGDVSARSAASAIERLLNSSSPSHEDFKDDSVCALVAGSDYTSLGDASRAPNDVITTHVTTSSDDAFTHVHQRSAFILSGGEDRQIRFWDLSSIEHSSILLSPEESKVSTYAQMPQDESSKHQPSVYREVPSSEPPKLRPTVIAQSQQNMLRAHQDAITTLALLQLPYKAIVSGDRKGVIKICS